MKGTEEYHGQCYCGAVRLAVKGAPASAGYCHCLSCRKWHSAPINAWAVWRDQDVRFQGGEVVTSRKGDSSWRIACALCGGAIANKKPQLGMMVVYPMTLVGSSFTFEPAAHLFYSERVMDVADGLPKFADIPEEYGGTGTLIEEPTQTRWCG